MHKPKVLLIQSRPEDQASDDEYAAFCNFGGLDPQQLVRLRADKGNLSAINLDDYAAVILGGGPANFAYPEDKKSKEQKLFEPWLLDVVRHIVAIDKPFLGVCLGMGAIVTALGGSMSLDYGEPADTVDITLLPVTKDDPLTAGMPATFTAIVGHKEGIASLPAGVVPLANNGSVTEMVRVGEHVYATQFHVELDAVGLATRLRIYANHGYFNPGEMDQIIARVQQADLFHPTDILRRFVAMYCQ